MTGVTSDFLQTMQQRGFIHQCTDLAGLDKAAKGNLVAYVGYDATADSLHVGNLVSIMMLRWLQVCGGTPITLMGGGTTKVGDPSGKDEARQLRSDADIAANIAAIQSSFANFLDYGQGKAVMVNNADWLDGLAYIPFLRDVGRHFSINRMLTFDSVKLRLEREQPLSFLEFNYMILQAYDFLELKRRFDCSLQMGGSDQWGNIVNGVDLTRRIAESEVFGLTTPLITTSSGQKMGKTAAGAVWLNPDRLSHFDYWQFWRNTEDGDVGRFLKLFTDLPLEEIARLEKLQGAELNAAKKILANEATRICRGEAASLEAAETARQTFEQGTMGSSLPQVDISAARLAEAPALFALFVEAGLAASNGEARRLIKGGGARLNDQPISEEARVLGADDFDGEGQAKLSAGKKRHAILKLV